MKVENFKTIIWVQIIVMMALSFGLSFIERSAEKDILRGACIGLMISLLIQFILFRLKPGWFEQKIKKHPHQI